MLAQKENNQDQDRVGKKKESQDFYVDTVSGTLYKRRDYEVYIVYNVYLIGWVLQWLPHTAGFGTLCDDIAL